MISWENQFLKIFCRQKSVYFDTILKDFFMPCKVEKIEIFEIFEIVENIEKSLYFECFYYAMKGWETGKFRNWA